MTPLKVFACYNASLNIRLASSSGAIFFPIAQYILSKQGIVYGVSMSEDCYSAEFISVTEISELSKLQGSNYLQAKLGNTFQKFQKNLQTGRMVLFSGTGCQINGLKSFLRKDYENLLCIDLICHGVPSPALWKKYAQYQETRNAGKLKNIYFRCKDEGHLYSNSTSSLKVLIPSDEDPYMKMFLKDYCLRPACYECTAKQARMSDLTIADFWGIQNVAPEMNDGYGTSLVLVRTEKGQHFFDEISHDIIKKEVTYEEGIRKNPAEYKSCAKPEERKFFFEDMKKLNFKELSRKYVSKTKISLVKKIKRIVKSFVKQIVRKIFRKAKGSAPNTDYCFCFVFDCEEKNERTSSTI